MIMFPARLAMSLFMFAFFSFRPVRVVSLAVAVSTLLVMHHRIGEDPDSLQELAEISSVDAGATAKALGMAGVVLNLLGEDLR
jgi:hypothetical protein